MMDKHASPAMARERIDGLISRMGALEAGCKDKNSADLFGAVRILAQGQKHCMEETEHLKKALDLITLEIFKISSRLNSDTAGR